MEYVTTIDAAGRVVIPKSIRDSLQLHGGARLRLVPRERGLLLEPIAEQPLIVRDHGIPVIHTKLAARPMDSGELREERASQLVDRALGRSKP